MNTSDRAANLRKVGNPRTHDASERKYFALLPHVVLAYCRTPHDLALWVTVKMVAGEDGVCILSARDLAELAGMSVGKVVDSRAHLLRVGLLTGRLYRDADYPLPVWHLRVPNLWPRNSAWRGEIGDSLRDRITAIRATRQNLDYAPVPDEEMASNKGYIPPHEGPTPPGEEPTSPHEEPTPPGEEPTPPGEAKKNLIEPIKGDEYENSKTPREIWDLAREMLRRQVMADTYAAWLQYTEGIGYDGRTFTIAVESDLAHNWLTVRFMPRIVAQLERIIGEKVDVSLIVR